jgi:hypothetical protein
LPSEAAADAEPQDHDCLCLTNGVRFPDAVLVRQVGVDDTDGRFADVKIERCTRCGRLWLQYQVEYAGFSRSGRWACVQVSAAEADGVTPEAAAGVIASRAWHIRGGSYWGHRGQRASGPIRWNL